MTRVYLLSTAFIVVLGVFNAAAGTGRIGWALYLVIVGWIVFQVARLRGRES